VCIVSHPVTDEITVGGCVHWPHMGDLDNLTSIFCAGVCGADGDNICGPMEQAVAATTWGSIKGMFR
jgi:hypothetical protein